MRGRTPKLVAGAVFVNARSPQRFLLSLALVFFSLWSLADERVRIGTANLTSGDKQSYDEGPGIRLLRGLNLDIALLQEFNYKGNSKADIQEFLETAFGKDYYYFREDSSSSSIPNGIVSRYRILQSGVIDDPVINNRDIVWAQIDVPGPSKLWAISVHLSHSSADKRIEEAKVILKFIQSLPPQDFVILGGDFNTRNRDEQALKILKQAVSDAHIPVDANGDSTTSSSRKHPYDLLLPNPLLDKQHSCLDAFAKLSGGRAYPDGLVVDSRTFRPIEGIAPARASDSGAKNMQHMMVVKEYVLPSAN